MFIGVAVAAPTVRLLQSVLFGVSPCDPLAFIGARLLILAIAAAAGVAPTRRVLRVNPLDRPSRGRADDSQHPPCRRAVRAIGVHPVRMRLRAELSHVDQIAWHTTNLELIAASLTEIQMQPFG